MPAKSASKLTPAVKLIIALGCSAALLSGCGIKGSLKTPPPVFGEKTVDEDRIPTDAETKMKMCLKMISSRQMKMKTHPDFRISNAPF